MSVKTKQVHRQFAGFIGIFLVIHFATHFAALGGIASQTFALNTGRAIYRLLPIEIALFAALAAQITLGLILLSAIARRPRKDFWHYAQAISGVFLALFILVHSSAAILSRWQFGLDTNFYWAAGSLTVAPLRYGFMPYYFIAVTALTTHLIAALHFRRPQRWHICGLLMGPISATLIILAYSGAFYSITLPATHREYFAFYLSILS